ncbi:MAG TPA: MFS transporter [Desulfatiglandales bacterium]|nr:MFS transporter [Desulfatiglandales bacterium]
MGKRIWMLLPLSLLFFLSQFYRATSAVIASELMQDLSLTAENLGFLSSVFFYAFALIQIPMGAAMDIFGAKRLILFLSSVGIVGAIIFALAHSFPVALIGRALIGVGMACALMGPYKLISIWFPPHAFATTSGLILSIGTLGGIVATAPLAFAVNWIGWRGAFLLIAFIHLVITIWIYSAVKDSPVEYQAGDISDLQNKNWVKGSLDGVLSVLRLPSFWLIALAAFVRYGTYISIAGLWAGPYLENVYNIPLIERGKILMLFPVGFLLGGPILGFLSDRVFKNRKIVALLAMGFYTIFFFPLTSFFPTPSLIMIAGIFFFIGFLTSCGNVMYANIKELLPGSISGTAMSAVNFFTMAGAGIFQHVMGITIDKFSAPQVQLPPEAFSFAFGLCFVSAALGTVAYLFVKEVHS